MRNAISYRGKRYGFGERHWNAKLARRDVELIIELREGGMSAREIAAKFEISRQQVWRIVEGKQRGRG